jgi:hypothetical protein
LLQFPFSLYTYCFKFSPLSDASFFKFIHSKTSVVRFSVIFFLFTLSASCAIYLIVFSINSHIALELPLNSSFVCMYVRGGP